MRSNRIATCFVVLASLAFGQSSWEGNDPTQQLPVTRVILYKNGVGYFEHAGRVRGNQEVHIDFTTAQLNDVLKSLTTLDLGGGRITGVSYNSIAPLARRLESLRLPVGENPSAAAFLAALRGAYLEVRNGSASAAGHLLNVDERETLGKGNEKIKVEELAIITDSGEVRTFDLTPATSVRILERDLNEEIGKYLKLISSSRDQDVRRMTISTAGSGARDLLVSYISEVPVWKSTYRIVVPREGKPLLQGWAVVDNTVGEDWNNIALSLVAGGPQSFVQELSQPYYARRPVIPLPENALTTPQTHEATMRETETVEVEASAAPFTGALDKDGQPAGTLGGLIGDVGKGSAGGTGSTTFHGRGSSAANRVAAAQESALPPAQGQELGDLFEYKLHDKLTIHKNQSALVPILQARVDAEKISVWNPSSNRALRALWLQNTSALTLDGGSFNVVEENAFAGEGLMDAIKPGEKRILSYATDLGLLVDARQLPQPQQVMRVAILHGAMLQTVEERQQREYTIRNRDTSPRTLVIEHPVRSGWMLADGEQATESTASYYRFRITIEPQKTAKLMVKEFHPLVNRYELANITDDQITFFLKQSTISSEVEQALRRIVSAKNDIAEIDAAVATRKAELSAISDDQQRVRENMKALKGSAEERALVERYARELDQQEAQVQNLQHEISDFRQKKDAARKRLDALIEGITLEAKL